MPNQKYVVNNTLAISHADDDTVYFISSKKRFRIKGPGMGSAARDILRAFVQPVSVDDAVESLSDKYSRLTLTKFINYLLANFVLVDEHEARLFQELDEGFLDKTLLYSLGGGSMTAVMDKLGSLKIGLIGSNHVLQEIYRQFATSGFCVNFSVTFTDYDYALPSIGDSSIAYYPLTAGASGISELIEQCDFVVAAAKYHDHYLFNEVSGVCHENSKEWLRVVIDGLDVEVGPIFVPSETCCYSCLHYRRRQNLSTDESYFSDLCEGKEFHEGAKSVKGIFGTIHPLNNLAASLAVAEAFKHFCGASSCLINQVLNINAQDFQTQTHYIYKVFDCPVCGSGVR